MLRTRAIHVALGLLLAACGATTPTHLQAADDHPPSPQVEHTLHQWQPTTTAAPTTTTTAAPPPPTTSTTQAPPVAPRVVASAPAQGYNGGCSSGDPGNMACWDRLAQCESGGNWHINTGNGYYGGIQFSLSSWRGVGGTGYPHEHSRETQIEMGRRLHAQGGWSHWPGCTQRFGWPQ